MPGHLRDYTRYTGLGLNLAVPVVLGCLLGLRLDREFSSSPALLIAGAVAGMAIGFIGFFAAVSGLEKKGKDEKE